MVGKKLLWWGYQHVNGSFQVKRFLSDDDISDARNSPFCIRATGPFWALDREEAIKILNEKLG